MTAAFSALYWLLYRDLIRFLRQRSRVIGAIVTPLLFWLLLGSGFGNFFQGPGQTQGGYLFYFYPGMLALSVLFTAIFSTISIIEDRHEGFLQGVLVSPVKRSTLLWSKLLSGAILGMLQGALLLAVAPFLGLSVTLVSLLGTAFVLLLAAMALTCLGFLLAWKIDSVAGYHSMMNVLLMPLWLLSGAVFPMEGRGIVLGTISTFNPMSYAVQSIRSFLVEGHDPFFAKNVGVLLFVLLLFFVPSLRLMKR